MSVRMLVSASMCACGMRVRMVCACCVHVVSVCVCCVCVRVVCVLYDGRNIMRALCA